MPKGAQQPTGGCRKRRSRSRMMMMIMMMEQLAITLLVCSLMIVPVDSVASPSDIISGREFLSILMKPGPATDHRASKAADVPLAVAAAATEQSPRNRGFRKFRHFFYEQQPGTGNEAEDETILPIEALFAEGSSRSVAGRQLRQPMTTSSTTEAMPTTVSEETEATTETVATTTEIQSGPESKEPDPEHHSNSHRSELSVEEVAPMEAEVQEQTVKTGRIGQRTERARFAPSQRTERKQESQQDSQMQTVNYHDKKGDASGDGSVVQKPVVSYRSFIGQSTPTDPRTHGYSQPARFYSEPAQFYSEPARIYSEPARIYGEPEKVYSEPARVYSQPARIYSEPAKVYSEPARVYSEPAKVYSQPSSYWQTAYEPAVTTVEPTVPPSTSTSSTTPSTTTTTRTTTMMTTTTSSDDDERGAARQHNRQRLVFNELDKIPYDQLNAPVDGDETVTLHNAIGKFVPKQQQQQQQGGNVAPAATLAPVAGTDGGDGDSKIGYVVEGRNYRKYRVEEKTPDGFIVGEYGVLSHNDGNLRGVRYTADSDINPRLIYDTLLKFLSL